MPLLPNIQLLFHDRPHFYIMSVVSIVVFASTIVIIVDKHL